MTLFLFLLAKAALASLPTVHFVLFRPPSTCRQVQLDQVFLLKPASVENILQKTFYKLSAGLRAPKSMQFLFSSSQDTRTVLDVLCHVLLVPSFYLKLSGRNCLCSLLSLSGYNWVPGHSSWQRRG